VPMALADQTWVLTGAAGRIATSVRGELAARVARLRLVDLAELSPRHPHEEVAIVDLRDPLALAECALNGLSQATATTSLTFTPL